ncbi:hypothetical protein V2J09_022805 [Rumex salicifolius]
MMLPSMNTAVCCLVAWITTHFLLSFLRRARRLPSGPLPAPVVGNLLTVGERRHRSLARLARTLDASREIRKKKVQQLVAHVEECSKAGTPLKVWLAAFSASLNLLSNTFFSVDMAADSDSDASNRLKELVLDIVKDVGKPNVVDYFPVLKWLDPQGVRPRIGALIDRIFKMFDEMIEPRLEREEDKTHKDVLDVLMGIAQESDNKFSL